MGAFTLQHLQAGADERRDPFAVARLGGRLWCGIDLIAGGQHGIGRHDLRRRLLARCGRLDRFRRDVNNGLARRFGQADGQCVPAGVAETDAGGADQLGPVGVLSSPGNQQNAAEWLGACGRQKQSQP